MSKLFLLCLCAASIACIDCCTQQLMSLIKNTTRGGGGGTALAEPPPFLTRGARGRGDWLSGIERKPEDRLPEETRKALLAEYNEGLRWKNQDAKLNFTQLVQKYGYPVETHAVTSEDGYMLTMFRIPHGVNKSLAGERTRRPVAFLMHGLIDSSDQWILLGPRKGLAYILADAGYDVWLGNARGNRYSRRHIRLNPDKNSFWEFSWDEIGRYDLPAMIDRALNVSGEAKVYYVGHSQGTTSFFVMCSSRPEYNAKIRLMTALAPVAWMSHLRSPLIRLLSPMSLGFEWVSRALGLGEFLPEGNVLSIAGGLLCEEDAFTHDICLNAMFVVTGYDVRRIDASLLPVFMGHNPAGASVRQLLHYGQEFTSGKFRRYDHGAARNRKVYGVASPPEYDVAQVTCPVSLVYSEHDWVSHPRDVDALRKKLPNVVDAYAIEPKVKFRHIDYTLAKDAFELVYERVLKMMPKY